MSWAQLGRHKRKSCAGRKLGDSLAPGPSTLSHLCPLGISARATRAPRETSPTQRTRNNFPGGGGRTLGICPRSLDHQISSRQITRSTHRLPSLRLPGSAWTRGALERPRRSGLFNLPLKGWGVRGSGASESLHLWREHLEVVLHPAAKAGAGIGRKRGSSPFGPTSAQPAGDEGSNRDYLSELGSPRQGARSRAAVSPGRQAETRAQDTSPPGSVAVTTWKEYC